MRSSITSSMSRSERPDRKRASLRRRENEEGGDDNKKKMANHNNKSAMMVSLASTTSTVSVLSETTTLLEDCGGAEEEEESQVEENNNLGVVETHEALPVPAPEPIGSSCTSEAVRRVWFNEGLNESFEDECIRTPSERAQSWYNNGELLSIHQRLIRDTCPIVGGGAADQKRLRSLFKPRHERQKAAKALQCKRVLSEAFKRCSQIQTEEDYDEGLMPPKLDRRRLQAIYQQDSIRMEGCSCAAVAASAAAAVVDADPICPLGLERYVMYGMRQGEANSQPKVILDAVNRRLTNMATQGDPSVRDHWMRLLSQYISLPSRVFVREVAMALATALLLEEQSSSWRT